jgi:hypothetical protein
MVDSLTSGAFGLVVDKTIINLPPMGVIIGCSVAAGVVVILIIIWIIVAKMKKNRVAGGKPAIQV